MFIYIAVGVIISAFYLVCSNNGLYEIDVSNRNRHKRQLVLLIIILILIQSLRDSTVGGDLYSHYKEYFFYYGKQSWQYLFKYEKHLLTYFLFNKLMYIVSSGNLQILLFAISFFFHVSLTQFLLKHSKNVYLSLFLYMATSGFNSSMNDLRQTIALSIVLFGISWLIENKKGKFLISILLAFLFHKTVVVFLVLYFAYQIRSRRTFILFILFISFFLSVGVNGISSIISKLFPAYTIYLEGGESSGGGGYALFFFMLFIAGILFYLSKDYLWEKDYGGEYSFFFRMLLCAIALQIFSFTTMFFARIVIQLFMISVIVVIPQFQLNNRISRGSRVIFNYALLLGFWAYYIFNLIQDSSATVPYKFFFL